MRTQGFFENKLLFPLGSKETKSSRWNSKPQCAFLCLCCLTTPQQALYDSALSRESTSLPHLQTIIEILNLSLFFPPTPQPVSFNSSSKSLLAQYPFVTGYSSGSPLSGHSWGVKTCWSANSLGCSAWKPALARGVAGLLSHLNDYQNWTVCSPEPCGGDMHFSWSC